MGQLTVKEKEHWKNRIGEKVDRAIEDLLASHKPGYMAGIRQQARKQALKSLGIDELHASLDKLSEDSERIKNEMQELQMQMVSMLRSDPASSSLCTYHYSRFIEEEIDRSQKRHERGLLAQDALGKQVLALQLEKEGILDTVWLATSSNQIRHLWTDMLTLLQQSPTQMQEKALAIETRPELD